MEDDKAFIIDDTGPANIEEIKRERDDQLQEKV